ncbi:hypothetical protein O1157_11655 [Streptomyces albogriseolus]
MYAGFVRHVYIVTDGQTPEWLDADAPGITVVDHKDIFPEGVLPVFNSHAIETRLHHIPGLSDHYLYFNDDVFVGRSVTPSTSSTATASPACPSRPTRSASAPRIPRPPPPTPPDGTCAGCWRRPTGCPSPTSSCTPRTPSAVTC